MDVSVVIPCYRSEGIVEGLVDALHETLSAAVDNHEIVLVVDGSPDHTADVAASLARTRPYVHTLLLRRNYGQHNALVAGIRASKMSVVVTMDDDMQHLPDQVPKLLAQLTDPHVDLVYGVPEQEEHGVLRSLASRSVKAALAASGVPNARKVSSFRAFRGSLRPVFDEVHGSDANVDVLLSWATGAVVSTKVSMQRRAQGASAYSPGRLVRHSMNMITGYSDAPLRLVTYLGLTTAALGLVLLAVVIAGFVTGRTTVAGFTTIASMVALFSAAQMLSIGILGEYLGRLHFRSMGRPTYVLAEDIGPDNEVNPGGGAHPSRSGEDPDNAGTEGQSDSGRHR